MLPRTLAPGTHSHSIGTNKQTARLSLSLSLSLSASPTDLCLKKHPVLASRTGVESSVERSLERSTVIGPSPAALPPHC